MVEQRDGWVTVRRRVIYGDTDAMGIVYYGNYLRFFEVGRNELFRTHGGTYKEIEEAGYALPVAEVGARYLTPARYDDEIEIGTRVEETAGARVRFGYRLRRSSDGTVLTEGFTVHGCISAATGKATRLPAVILDRLGVGSG